MKTSNELIGAAKWNLAQYETHKHISYLISARDLLSEALSLAHDEKYPKAENEK